MMQDTIVKLGNFKVLSNNPAYLYSQCVTVEKNGAKPFTVDVVQQDKRFSCSLNMQGTEEYRTKLTLHKDGYHLELVDCDVEMLATGTAILSIGEDFVEVPMVLNIPDCLVYRLYGQPIILPYEENIKPTLLDRRDS